MNCTGCGEEVYGGQPCACYRKETAALEAENERLRAALQQMLTNGTELPDGRFVVERYSVEKARTVLVRGEEASSG